jgi:6-phosphogluconolactonase
MNKNINLIYVLILFMMFLTACHSKNTRLFASKLSETGEKGLFVFDLNLESGTFKLLSGADAGPNPSYFCISKKRELIYAANEIMEFNGVKGGGVTTLRYIPESGSIEKVNEQVVPAGGPCFISLSHGEDFLFFASYLSGSVAVVKLDYNGIPERVTDTILFRENEGNISHPHMILSDPGGKKVYLTDLGLNRIVIYDFDAHTGHLKQAENGIVNLISGSGPRHFVFNSTGTKMYVICELNSSISVFDVDSTGGLKSIQTMTTLSDSFNSENFCADIHLGKNGQYLYGSNRGENTIVVFRIGDDGRLNLSGRIPCGGNWPRNFVIDPSGKFILVGNQRSGNISLFKIDGKTGFPEYTEDYKLDTPVCLKF